jgi:HD-GYP domain-containing protein (c-di-GMP phosphodiesterase class II)/DNA-binding CsgD family transcriptional regulator
VPASVRLAEILAALSLTTDLGSGLPLEKGLRTCLVADAFAAELELDLSERRAVYHAALLRAIGCTAHSSENAALFEDDLAFSRAFKVLDPGDPARFARQLSDGFGALAERFVEVAPTAGPVAGRAFCEVSRGLGTRLALPSAALAALDEMYERWDGLGLPEGRSGEGLTLAARVVHLAEQAVLAHAVGGPPAACAEVARRAGGHLDPELCARFAAVHERALAPLDQPDPFAAVLSAEPPPAAAVPAGELERLLLALAAFADLKGTHLIGHSTAVAQLAGDAARLLGGDPAPVRQAALVQDLGRTAVSSAVWDRAGPLGSAEWERVRLHPYWTQRILERAPALAGLASAAAAHHERLDGSGYHRGARAGDLPVGARVLAPADAFAAMVQARPHRPALPPAAAARALMDDARAGRLDPDAAAAVVEAAGLPRPPRPWPCDLTDREVDVLRLAVRGLSNQGIAEALVISPRTVQHHLAHVYEKTGRRTRAGAAVFAIEHGLVPAEMGRSADAGAARVG